MKLEFSRQIFEKSWNIKFDKNPSSGSRVAPCGRKDRQTWRTEVRLYTWNNALHPPPLKVVLFSKHRTGYIPNTFISRNPWDICAACQIYTVHSQCRGLWKANTSIAHKNVSLKAAIQTSFHEAEEQDSFVQRTFNVWFTSIIRATASSNSRSCSTQFSVHTTYASWDCNMFHVLICIPFSSVPNCL
jgi:hypothetical protein